MAAKAACGNGFPLNIPSEIATGGGGGASSADDVSYDNTSSGLTADNVQAAIDEVAGDLSDLGADGVAYDNTDSGLVAENVQAAIDEVAGDLSDLDEKVNGIPANVYDTTEAIVGKWGTADLYRKYVTTGTLPNTAVKSFDIGITTETVRRIEFYYSDSAEYGPIPNNESTVSFNKSTKKLDVATSGDYSGYTGIAIIEYTKA